MLWAAKPKTYILDAIWLFKEGKELFFIVFVWFADLYSNFQSCSHISRSILKDMLKKNFNTFVKFIHTLNSNIAGIK